LAKCQIRHDNRDMVQLTNHKLAPSIHPNFLFTASPT
jgi:hypothetical protein